MEDWQVKLQLEAMALMVEVEGMKAENAQREQYDQTLAYTEDSFQVIASQINDLAREMCNR